MNLTIDIFINDDAQMAQKVEPLEEVIDELSVEMKSRHISRLRMGKCTVEMGFILQDLTTSFERVADHCSNIAIYVLQEEDNEVETHDMIDYIKQSGRIDFEGQMKEYRSIYQLPERSAQ